MNFFSLIKRNTIFFFKKKINIDNHKFKKNIQLNDLFLFYGTDKSSHSHGFSKFYIKHLNRFKNKKINILEIGAATGASASAFAHYFKKSKIYCVDINLTLVKYESKKINYFGINSSDKKKLLNLIEKLKNKFSIKNFDIIIDDGSHILSDQLKALNFFFNKINKNGFYIIEDYKFPNYFKRCKDVNENTIDSLIKKIIKKNKVRSKILNDHTIDQLYKSKIYKYKGNLKISDIVFLKKI